MADMLADGFAWLAARLKSHAAKAVTYRRGASSVVIQATLATQLMRTSDRDGNTKVERPDADFVFTAADLDFGAGVVEPAAGDTIDVVFGAVTKRFKLMPMNSGQEPAWRFCDPHQTMVRAHTKFTGTV